MDFETRYPEVAADPRLKQVHAIVEATHNEQHVIWQQFSAQASKFHPQQSRRIFSVNDDSQGWFFIVGELAEMPVTLLLSFSKFDDSYVLFYHMPSVVTDSRMADAWLDKYVRTPTGEKPPRSDATNVFNLLWELPAKAS